MDQNSAVREEVIKIKFLKSKDCLFELFILIAADFFFFPPSLFMFTDDLLFVSLCYMHICFKILETVCAVMNYCGPFGPLGLAYFFWHWKGFFPSKQQYTWVSILNNTILESQWEWLRFHFLIFMSFFMIFDH